MKKRVDISKSRIHLLDEHTREVLSKSIASTLVKIAGMIVGLLVSIFLGQKLGADGLGIINISNKIVNVLIIVGLLGMRQVIIKEVAIAHSKKDSDRISNVMYTAYWINGSLSIIITVILIILTPWIANHIFHEDRLVFPLTIALIVLTPQVFSRLFSSGFVGFRKIWQSNLVEQALSIAITGLSLFFLWIIGIDITINNTAICYAIGRIGVTISVGTYWRKLHPYKLKGKLLSKDLMAVSIPLFWATLSSMIILSIDAIMLGWLSGSEDVGMYTVASQIALLTIFFQQITNAAVSPKLASLFESRKIEDIQKMTQKVTIGLGIIGIAQLLMFIILGRSILGIWGKEFVGAYWVLVILSIGQFFNNTTGITGPLLMMCGQEQIQKKISLVAVFINIILNYLLIKKFGAVGAAIATSITLIGQNTARILYAKSRLGISIISNNR